MENTLIRSSPCPECGGEMRWTQNAWKTGDTGRAAYSCDSGHLADPATTRQCPACGIHDTVQTGETGGRSQHRCARCHHEFEVGGVTC